MFNLSKIIVLLFVFLNITNVFANNIKNSAVVFMYHKFGISKYPSTSVTIDQLNSHINELKKNKYNVKSLDFIVSKQFSIITTSTLFNAGCPK